MLFIGESSRTFGERFKEHQKAPSPIFDHSNITGHQVTIENFNIVGREDQNLSRTIKEALYIRVNNQSLNRNIVLCKAVWSNHLIFMCLGVIILHMIVCTAIHNCSSSGSLFFASLRWNN